VYLLSLININNEAAADRVTLQITAFEAAIGFKNWHFFLPEDGTLVKKHVGDASLKFVLIS
jgi:hypothetical protein